VQRPLPELPGVEHRYVEVRGVRLHVAEAGAGDPIVLLHGWPQHWWEWRHVIAGLSDSFRVICPDQRGFGWSDAPENASYLKEDLADEYVALLDALGLDRVRLVGHDWGGVMGFLMCLRHPERIERYLALNTAHPFVSLDTATMFQTWRLWYQLVIASPWLGQRLVGGGQQRFVRFLEGWAGGQRVWSEHDAELYLAALREPARARASVAMYRTYQLQEVMPALRGRYKSTRLKTPTLFLHGAEDPAIRPAFLRGFERYADDMTLELVQDTGHWIAEQRPELVVSRAREWFLDLSVQPVAS
jgi:pimeloyl-ACP methyl ester carboxylesterase